MRTRVKMTLQLSETETSLLRHLLEYYLRETSNEISNTEKFEFREKLKRERDLVRKIAGQLREPA